MGENIYILNPLLKVACDLLGSFTNVLKVTQDMCVQLWSVTVTVRPKRCVNEGGSGTGDILHCCCTEVGGCKWGGQNALLWVFHSLNVAFNRDTSKTIY